MIGHDDGVAVEQPEGGMEGGQRHIQALTDFDDHAGGLGA